MTDDKYQKLSREFDASPYAEYLGIRIVELGDRYVKLKMTVQEHHMNHVGLLHGGVTMAIADQAFACCTNTIDGMYVAVQFNINLFSTAKPGDVLTAEGKLFHAGRTISTCEVSVVNSSGKVMARATGTGANVARSS